MRAVFFVVVAPALRRVFFKHVGMTARKIRTAFVVYIVVVRVPFGPAQRLQPCTILVTGLRFHGVRSQKEGPEPKPRADRFSC